MTGLYFKKAAPCPNSWQNVADQDVGFCSQATPDSHTVKFQWRGPGVQGCDKKVAEFRPNPGSSMDLWGGTLGFIPTQETPAPSFPGAPAGVTLEHGAGMEG